MENVFKDEPKPSTCEVLADEKKVSDNVRLNVPEGGLEPKDLLYSQRTDDLRLVRAGCGSGNQMVLVECNLGGKISSPYREGDILHVLHKVIENG